jgi:aryl carrier-like protein
LSVAELRSRVSTSRSWIRNSTSLSRKGLIGEIWIAGSGKCLGYWNNPELTLKQFRARLVDDSPYDDGYLRTGDMGFFHNGELFVCGRIKDMIILRGQNYYPQDIENVVERASGLIRANCVAAFQIHEDSEPALAIVAEVKNPKALPDARKIAAAVRNYLNVEVALISFIAPRAIPRTSSGKIMRHKDQAHVAGRQFTVLSEFSREKDAGASASGSDIQSSFDELKARYNLTGNESYNLVEAGLDSLDLVVFMHELKELLKDKGAEMLARQVDIGVIQRVSVAELFQLAEQLERAPEEALVVLRHSLAAFREEQRAAEKQMMSNDRKLIFEPRRQRLARDTGPESCAAHGRHRFHRTVPDEEPAGTDAGEDLCSRPGFRRRSGQAKTEGGDGIDGALRGRADADVRGSRHSHLRRSRAAKAGPDAGRLGFPRQ